MTILPISPENLDGCVRIYLQAYNKAPWNYQWPEDKAKKYLLEYMSTPQFTGFAIYDQDVVVAAVFAHKKTWWTAQQIVIDEFFVTPERQRMGYGKKLINHINGYARENAIDLVILMTNKYMPSYKFYNKIGFTTTEQFVYMFNQVSEI